MFSEQLGSRICVAETSRLRLRRLASTDAAFILEVLNDSDFIDNVGDRGVRSLHDARRYISEGPAASYARFGFGLYLVELKESGLPIGLCGLLTRDTHPDVEIAFATLRRARGQGYTLEAAMAILKLGIDACGLRRIVAVATLRNSHSMSILERLGLQFERIGYFTADDVKSCLFAFSTLKACGRTNLGIWCDRSRTKNRSD